MDTPSLNRRGLLFGLAGVAAAAAAATLIGLPAPAEAQNPPQMPAGAATGGRFGEGRQTGVPQSPRAARMMSRRRRMMMSRRRRMMMMRRRRMMMRNRPMRGAVRRNRTMTRRGMNTNSR